VISDLAKLWRYRELLAALALKEVSVRYKQSLFGVAWAIINPAFTMVIFTLVFSRFLKVDSEGIPYPVFAYAALLPWQYFSTSITGAANSVVANAGLVTKIYFPREVFPLAKVMAGLVDFAIAAAFLGLLMIVYGVAPSPTILLVPVLLVIQIVLTVGIGLILAAVNVFFRDIQHVIALLMQLWMFATPIAYSASAVPERYRTLYMVLNPMAPIIDGYRKVIVARQLPDMAYLSVAAAIAGLAFLVGYALFKKLEFRFAEVI